MDEVKTVPCRARGLVTAQDGTRIAYERYGFGEGPPLILVGGAGGAGGNDSVLAGLLAQRFPVVAYERRTGPGAGRVEREIADLAALVDAVGAAGPAGPAAVHGTASGGALALAAAAAGVPVGPVSVYEPTYPVGGEGAAVRLGRVPARVLVVDGGASPSSTRRAARTVAAAVPRGRHRTLTGQTHEVSPHVLAPVLADFYAEEQAGG
ncbi:alpha/beta fold hydrolase [Streptomyces sp. NPDC004267]|uniref:alpha/beta fold hydrolase n=1 Tax=Streptomyces sp. NPDC004267 TaxID=3364694 RepID=UPI003696593D